MQSLDDRGLSTAEQVTSLVSAQQCRPLCWSLCEVAAVFGFIDSFEWFCCRLYILSMLVFDIFLLCNDFYSIKYVL